MKNYRHDIDGLRALAVLAVVFYHLNPRIFPGGFIGVDIFFVISGFLITQIILSQLDQSVFSVLTFYKRRIARLFPALFLMLFCATLATYLISHPIETVFFGESLIASIFYFSNVFYLTEANYFSVDPKLNPLLHTWSLAVEEQFYLLYPLLLIAAYKLFRRHLITILILLTICSFLLNIYLVQKNPAAAFFLTPTRIYQLMAGGLLAIALLNRTKLSAELAAFVGLLLILISIFIFSDESVYPGFNSLLPTLATVLILFGAADSIFARITLTNPIAKLVGKMSYSIYLWHWPIIVFYQIAHNPQPKRYEQVTLLIVTLVVSFISWKFIEVPLRYKVQSLSVKKVFQSAFLVSVVGLIVGSLFIFSDGLRDRFSTERLYFAEYVETYRPSDARSGNCFLTSYSQDIRNFTEDRCIKIHPAKRNVLLLGDSHVNRLYYPIRDNLPDASVSQITASGCRPTVSNYGSRYCLELMQKAFNDYIPNYKFDTVILFAYWKHYDPDYLSLTVDLISKHVNQVIVFGPMVTYEQALPRLLARFSKNGKETHQFKKARNYEENISIDAEMHQSLLNSSASYVSLLELVCPDGICKTLTESGEPIQVDYGHFSYAGGVEIIQDIIGRGVL